MKHGILLAALCTFSNAQAATYVYQANAYQGHYGTCGGGLLPFQLTITTPEAVPPNTTVLVPFKTLTVTAGGNSQWSKKYNKKHSDSASFTTDANATVVMWEVSAAARQRRQLITENEGNDIHDIIRFRCGGANVDNNPGVWTRTE